MTFNMKYIRTKDGIYKTSGLNSVSLDKNIIQFQKNISENKILIINANDVLKQADTIEELIMPGDLVRYEWLYMSWIEKDRGDKVRGIDMHLIDRKSVCDLWIQVGENPDFKLVASKSKDDEKLCLIQ